MDFKFTPTNNNMAADFKLPYFEDARADFAPYYTACANGTSPEKAKMQVSSELSKFGAGILSFQDGVFQAGKLKRYGYNIYFSYGGSRGLIRVAGLPIKFSPTPKKVEAVKIQALLNVRDWLKVALTSRTFSPGADSLIPFMLVDQTPGRERTVADFIAEQGNLPRLNPPPNGKDIIEGEFEENPSFAPAR